MSTPQLSVEGTLVSDPELKFSNQGKPYCKLRIATSDRQRQNDGSWKELGTTFLDLVAFGPFAENVAESLKKGMAVVGLGRLKQNDWETRQGEKRTSYQVELMAFGPDLRRATAQVLQAQRDNGRPRQGPASLTGPAVRSGGQYAGAVAGPGPFTEPAPKPMWSGSPFNPKDDEPPF